MRFVDYTQKEAQLLFLAASGLDMLMKHEKVAEVFLSVADILGESEDAAAARLVAAREQASLARAEVDTDFPLLHAHSLVTVWGALDAMIEDTVVAWLTHRPSLLQHGDFASVRVPVAEFQSMTLNERIEYLIAQVPQPTGVGGGVPRFEALLGRIGLVGSVDDEVRRALIEAHQIRNVYAHRGGIADKRAIASCPWMAGWTNGAQILVCHRDYERYTGATLGYATEVFARAAAKFGVDVRIGLQERAEKMAQDERRKRRARERRRVARELSKRPAKEQK